MNILFSFQAAKIQIKSLINTMLADFFLAFIYRLSFKKTTKY